MKYSLLMFAKGDVGFLGAILLCIIAVALIIAGIVITRIPADAWLNCERRARTGTGQWIYERELKASGDEKRAFAKAEAFYKLFGAAFVVMGLIQLVVWTCRALITYGN